MAEKIDPARLVTVGTYAEKHYDPARKVNRSYVYKLIRQQKLETVDIDGVTFVVLPATPAP